MSELRISNDPDEIHRRIEDVIRRIKEIRDAVPRPPDAELQINCLVSELNIALSERAELSASKMERMTSSIKGLTWVLIIFTVILTAIAVFDFVKTVCYGHAH